MAPTQEPASAADNAGDQADLSHQVTQQGLSSSEQYFTQHLCRTKADRHDAAMGMAEALELYRSAQEYIREIPPGSSPEWATGNYEQACSAYSIACRRQAQTVEQYRSCLASYRFWQESQAVQGDSTSEPSQEPASSSSGGSTLRAVLTDATPPIDITPAISAHSPQQARTMVPNGVHVSSASTPDHEPSVWGPAASVGPVDTDEDNSAHTFLWQIDDAHSRAIFEQRSEHHLCRAPAQPSYRAGAPLALRQLFIERTTTQSEAVASGPQQSPDRSLDGPVTASDTETDSQHEGPPRLVTDGRSPTFGYFLEPQTPVTEQVQEGLDDKSESENVNSLEEH